MKEYIKGALYGAAIGDALGGPVEYMKKEDIKSKFGTLRDMVGGGRNNLEPGQYTDDTHMLLHVAEGILANPMYPVEEIGRRFIAWYREQPDYVGPTTALSFKNYLLVGNWKDAARATATTINKMDSNGGLMRTLAVTFGYQKDTSLMAYWSKEIASMTHYSEEGAACCIFYNYLVYLASRASIAKREMITKSLQFTDEQCKKYGLYPSNFFWFIVKCVQSGTEELLPKGNALYTVGTAVQCFLQEDSFEDILVSAINRGEDADTAGTVTGGLAGAYYGFEGIPERWVGLLKGKERLDRISAGFVAMK